MNNTEKKFILRKLRSKKKRIREKYAKIFLKNILFGYPANTIKLVPTHIGLGNDCDGDMNQDFELKAEIKKSPEVTEKQKEIIDGYRKMASRGFISKVIVPRVTIDTSAKDQ